MWLFGIRHLIRGNFFVKEKKNVLLLADKQRLKIVK